MLRKIGILLCVSVILSCSDDDESTDDYFMVFSLRQGEAKATTMKVQMENTEPMNGNDILNSDQAAIGIQISATFKDPADNTITQSINFGWSREVPKVDVTFASNGIPVLKDPSKITEYLPRTNLFKEQSTSFGSYFHENVMTFCTAGVDPANDNTFRILDVKQYKDLNNKEVMELTAEFSVRYLTVCHQGNLQVTDGVLRTKIELE